MADIKSLIVAVLGYILAFLIPVIGFLYGLILFFIRKDDPFFNRQAKIIMVFAIFMWVLNMVLIFTFVPH